MKNLYYPSGKLYACLSGEKKEYFYEDGTPKTRLLFLNGKFHFESVLFYPSGRMKRKCHFEDGLRHGLDQMWDEDGLLIDEGSYDKGKPVGFHRRFRKGQLIEEVEYIDSKRFNLRQWDENGAIRIEALWDELNYKERVWDCFQNIWVEKEGFWNGKKLVYL